MRKRRLSKILLVSVMLLLPALVVAATPPGDVQKAEILNKTYRMQVPFIENKGQVEDDNISFYARTFGGTVFVGKDGTLTYSLPFEDKGGVVIKEVIADENIEVKGLEPSPTRINYFKGNDQSKWKTDIPSYNSISLGEVYKGVELTLKAYGKNVEKLFKVLPGKDPGEIKVKLKGAENLVVNEKGELEVITEHGPVTFTKPVAYQEIDGKRVEVSVSYKIEESEFRSQESEYEKQESGARSQKAGVRSLPPVTRNPEPGFAEPGTRNPQPATHPTSLAYSFKVGNYNDSFPLIIDPLLASTFIGGGGADQGQSLVLDGSGNVYVTGQAGSGYPTTAGAYDETLNGSPSDVFVSKLNNNLSSLLASTFIGGEDSYAEGLSLALDGSGNVYVTGSVAGAGGFNYPTTTGAYDETYNGTSDVFVSKLDGSLSTLLASTFIGGGGNDRGNSLVLDGSGNVYVTGGAGPGYPTTTGAYDETYGGLSDVVISKLNGSLSTLLASTYIGVEESGEEGLSLALDGGGNVYVTGFAGNNYPTTTGAYDETYNGGLSDVFVSKLNNNLSSLVASTYIGGEEADKEAGYSLVLDGSGNVYVTGEAGFGFPTIPGAYDETHNGNLDVFVSKLNSSLSTLLASTYIGGINVDAGRSLALDGSGNVYLTGNAHSPDYPTTPGAYDTVVNDTEVIVSKLDSNLSSLLTSTFIGGGGNEYGQSLVPDGSGNVYLTGYGWAGYPTTAGAYDETYNAGTSDVIVSKLDMGLLSDSGGSFRSGVDTGGFTGSGQFLEDIPPLDDPFAIVQCQNYTIVVDFWLTDWQGANVKAMDYYFTWDASVFTVVSVTSENSLWNIHPEPSPVGNVYHLYLESTAGIPGPHIKLHTVELSFTTVPAEGKVKAELLPDGYIEDVDSTQHQSIGKTEITLKTICDVNATTTCDEDHPCDVLDSADICPGDANIVQDNYSWQVVDSQTSLCEGDRITVYHTKTGTHLVEASCTEDICTSECFNSCLTACREIEINECTVRGIGNCINGIVFPWDETTCFNYSRRTDCNGICLEDCTADCAGGNAFYNRHCGFAMNEVITMRVPDGTGGCTGAVKRERTLSGDGTAWIPMAVPLQAGSYDLCSGTQFIGTVVVKDCGEPTCSLTVHGDFTVDHGANGTLEVTMEDLNAEDTYALSLEYWKDDAHTIPLTENFPDFLEIDLEPKEVTVGPNGTATFNVTVTNAEPGLDGQVHWANITVRADPDSHSWDCECSFDLDIVSDEDGDGIPLGEDNCPDYPNGPLKGTCTFIIPEDPENPIASTGQFCEVDTQCNPGEFCEKEQADHYPHGGNGIGDACDCEADFICDGDVDAEDMTAFLADFGRGQYDRPCNENSCNGDFSCDGDVDGGDVTLFLEDFGRGQYDRPCPLCDGSAWCSY